MVPGHVRASAWVGPAPAGRVIRKASTLYALASIGKLVPVFPSGAASGFPVSSSQSCASEAVVVPQNRPVVKRMLLPFDGKTPFDPPKGGTTLVRGLFPGVPYEPRGDSVRGTLH